MWKQLGESEYVLGLEPGTALPLGRDKIRERGELIMIGPGEKRDFHIEIEIIEGREALNIEKERINSI